MRNQDKTNRAPGVLQDQVVFLTGGAQGIGHECALAYAREGAHVVIADVQQDAAVETLHAIQGHGLALTCDVGDTASVQAAVQAALRHYGRLDAVHNNAGMLHPTVPLHETTEDEWDAIHRVNLKSVYLTTRFTIDALKSSKGCILNTASLVGIIGQANHAAYVATKGGMIALTKAMALDYAPFGVRVNAVCPAGVWTPGLQTIIDPNIVTPEQENLRRVHPLGYFPKGDVIADAALFLVSSKARFITGCILPVSGGAELGYRH